MKKELIISQEEDCTKIALLEDGRLFELHEEEEKSEFVVGDLFLGKVKNRIHIGFKDPGDAVGTEEEVLNEFRKIRDEILRDFFTFCNKNIR